MKLALRRGLACLPLLAVFLVLSCQAPPAPSGEPATAAGYALDPANPVFNLEREGMKVAWRQEFGQTTSGELAHIYAAGDYLVAESADNQVHVYNSADYGTYKTGAVVQGPLLGAPAVSGATLFLAADNRIFPFDVSTGVLAKGFRTAMALSATPLVYQDSLILASASGDVARMAMSDGKIAWSKSIEGPILDQPVIEGGIVYAAAQKDKAIALKLDTGEELWRLKPMGPARLSSGVGVYGKSCYVGDNLGTLYGLSAELGRIEWTKSLPAPVIGTPRVVGDKVLVFTNQPSVVCLRGGAGPQVLWSFDGAVRLLATGQKLAYFLTDDNCVAAVSLEDGKVAWRDALPPHTMVAGSDLHPEFFIADRTGAIVAIAELE